MRYKVFILASALLFIFFACRKDEQILKSPGVKLKFTTDTVMFDTVFTRAGSVTKWFLVHNTYKKSINISSITLGGHAASSYNINVDGQPATNSNKYQIVNYTVLPGDSFYIFVNVNINPNGQNQPFVVTDSIIFETNGNRQVVRLVAWGQDAHYLKDSVLNYDATWINDKPYVIYNSILINQGNKLIVQPGVKIYSNGKSMIYVGGTLEVDGTVDEPVTMLGVRLEQYYKDNPGQWGGVRILPKSVNNYFKNLHLRNANIGIEVDSLPVNSNPNLILENVMVENMSAACLAGYTGHVRAFNCLFDNSCEYLFFAPIGGNYEFYQCTFGQSNCLCSSQYAAVTCDNQDFTDSSGHVFKNQLKLTLVNSIIWEDINDLKTNQLEIDNTGQFTDSVTIDHTLVQTTISSFNLNSNIINKDPLFSFPCKYEYKPDSLSPAIKAGNISLPALFPQTNFDILGKPRVGNPDLGAYERQ